MARKPLEIPPSGERCIRSICRGRCRRPRCPGRRLCEKHCLIEKFKKLTNGKKLSSRVGDPATSSAAKRPRGHPVAVAIRAKKRPSLTRASSAHDSATGSGSIVELRRGEDERGRKGRPGSRGGKMVKKKRSSRQKEEPVMNKVGVRNRSSDAAAEKKLESKKRKRRTPKYLQLEKVRASREVSNPLELNPINGDLSQKKEKGKPSLPLKGDIFYAFLKKDWVSITTELSAPHINVKQEEQTMEEVVPPLEITKVSRCAVSDAREPSRVVTLGDAPHINVKHEEQTMEKVVPPLEIPKVSRCTLSDAREPLRDVTLGDAPHINLKQEEQTMEEVVPPLEIPKVSSSDAREPLRVVTLGDIWVLFHDADSLPRTYARIERIFPVHEKVQVTLLKFHPVCDEEMLWVEKGVPVSCGMYRTSKSMVLRDMSILAQLVFNDPDGRVLGLKTFYKIFPKKGEIWAVFRDCSESETCPLFHLVEVLTNFSEVDGVSVSVLMPVDGLKGLFMRQTSGGLFVLQSFTRRELLRFSHRLPALRVAENGGSGSFAAFWRIG